MSTTKKTLQVGQIWEFPATERVSISRPDGSTVESDPIEGVVAHALTQPGTYISGDQTITAK